MISEDFSKVWMKLSKEWRNALDQELAPLTEGQLYILELLIQSPLMKPSDLLQYLSTTPAAITTILDRMEKNELIERIRDEKDRRIVWIHVKEKGKQEANRGQQVKKDVMTRSLDKISAHNQQLLVFLLGKVASNE